MRRVTQQEGEGWRALAQQHGFGSAEGRFVLSPFIVERIATSTASSSVLSRRSQPASMATHHVRQDASR